MFYNQFSESHGRRADGIIDNPLVSFSDHYCDLCWQERADTILDGIGSRERGTERETEAASERKERERKMPD